MADASASDQTPYCRPVWSWTKNDKGQDACQIAALMVNEACSSQTYDDRVTYPLERRDNPFFKAYPPLQVSQATDGMCSVPTYNLVQMCAACQALDTGSISWWNYTANCQETRYKVPVPSSTSLPQWAFADPTDQDGHFNISSAYEQTTGRDYDDFSELLAMLMSNSVSFNVNHSVEPPASSTGNAALAASNTAVPPPPQGNNGAHHKKPPIAILASVGAVVLVIVFGLGILVGSSVRRRRRKDKLGVRLGSGSQILPDGEKDDEDDEMAYGRATDMIEARQQGRGATSFYNRPPSSRSGTNSISTHSHSFSSYLAKRRTHGSSRDSLDSRTSGTESDWYSSTYTTSYPSSARHAPRDNVLTLTRETTVASSTSNDDLDPFEDGSDLISLTPSHDAPSSTGAHYGRDHAR